MKSIIRVLAVTVATAGMLLATTATSAQAQAQAHGNPPSWCRGGGHPVDGPCTS